MFRIKVGCQISYAASAATPAVLIVKPPSYPTLMLARETFELHGATATGEYIDGFGNRCQRITLAAGASTLRYDAVAVVPSAPDVLRPGARQVPPEELPPHLLRYTLPSRYAETDKLLGFAWETFGNLPSGWDRARGVCDWVRRNIEYKPGVSWPHWSASDTIARRQGVCRDRAHVIVALCRALNMPARYVVSYLPDIDVPDDGYDMDFHAYAEVWLEGGWTVFDPHREVARKGRVFLASGLDAADAAFATLYGGARLVRLDVWADAVDERERKLDLALPSIALAAAPDPAIVPAAPVLAPAPVVPAAAPAAFAPQPAAANGW
jgi:transglutaminase-like putative cysteine protease